MCIRDSNKAALIERIADLVNEKKLEGISDIRDDFCPIQFYSLKVDYSIIFQIVD